MCGEIVDEDHFAKETRIGAIENRIDGSEENGPGLVVEAHYLH